MFFRSLVSKSKLCVSFVCVRVLCVRWIPLFAMDYFVRDGVPPAQIQRPVHGQETMNNIESNLILRVNLYTENHVMKGRNHAGRKQIRSHTRRRR